MPQNQFSLTPRDEPNVASHNPPMFGPDDAVKLTFDIPGFPCGTTGKVVKRSASGTDGTFTWHVYLVQFKNGNEYDGVPEKALEKIVE